jgi:hypothetical protein
MLRTLSSVRFVFCCAVCKSLFFAQRRTHTCACGAASMLHSSPGCAACVHTASDPDACQSSRFICQEDIDACVYVSRSARGDTCAHSLHRHGSLVVGPTSTHARMCDSTYLVPSFHGKADGVFSVHQRDACFHTEYCCTWRSPCLLARLCKQLVHSTSP